MSAYDSGDWVKTFSASATIDLVISSNSNRYATAWFLRHVADAARTVNSMTVGTKSMNLITTIDTGGAGTMFIYGLINPDSGTQVVQLAWDSAPVVQTTLAAMSFYEVDQVSATGGWAKNSSGNWGTASTSVTSSTTDLVVSMLSTSLSNGQTVTDDAGQVRRVGSTGFDGNLETFGSTSGGGANVTMGYTITSGNFGGLLVIPLLTAAVQTQSVFTDSFRQFMIAGD